MTFHQISERFGFTPACAARIALGGDVVHQSHRGSARMLKRAIGKSPRILAQARFVKHRELNYLAGPKGCLP